MHHLDWGNYRKCNMKYTVGTYEIWDAFFKDRYISPARMYNTWKVLELRDKNQINKNKTYVKNNGRGYYYSDIKEFIAYNEKVERDILYAQQLTLDILYLLDNVGLQRGYKGKVAKLLGVPNNFISGDMGLSHKRALDIIHRVKTRLEEISPEARRDLVYRFNQLKNI